MHINVTKHHLDASWIERAYNDTPPRSSMSVEQYKAYYWREYKDSWRYQDHWRAWNYYMRWLDLELQMPGKTQIQGELF